MTRPIVFATDFSSISDEAQPHAVHLARLFGAPLRLLHVVEAHAPGAPVHVFDPALEANIAARVDEQFEEREAALAGSGVAIERVDRRGVPTDEILGEAEAANALAVVIGTHGDGGFLQFFVGSVGTRIIRRSSCPVLIVPPGCDDPPWTDMLYPTDFSPLCTAGFEHAVNLAHRAQIPLEIFHAEIPYESALMGYGPGEAMMAELPMERQLTDERMGELSERARQSGVTVTTHHVLESSASQAIVERAIAANVGIIVMAAHGRSGFERFIHGSVTEDVMNDLARPLLVLPGPGSVSLEASNGTAGPLEPNTDSTRPKG